MSVRLYDGFQDQHLTNMSLLNWFLGKPLTSDEDAEERVGVIAGVSDFGLDALGSAAYGPEAALTVLMPAAAAGIAYVLPISLTIIALLLVVFFSYRQTIEAYPNGGGSYTVAGKNLGGQWGLLAAAALMLDYLLDVGVGISTGVGALVSAAPKLGPHTLGICLIILALLTVISLRGVRESGFVYTGPTYLFIVCLIGVLGWGAVKTLLHGGHPPPVVAPPAASARAVAGVSAWLLIRAFAGGCTALTGLEAVSNGVKAFKDPNSQTARRTLTVIVVLLAVFVAGIAHLTRAYGIMATEPGSPNYQSLLSMVTAAVTGKGVVYYVTIASILLMLSLSANTAFADFPRLCRAIAEDGYLPRFFATRGRRLVYTEGVLVLAFLSAVILIMFRGVTDRLIPLFAIGAFLAFTLSQAGMVAHWKQSNHKRARWYMAVNGVGTVATGCTVIVVLVAKFTEGAWITVMMVPLLILLMRGVHKHYVRVALETNLSTLMLDATTKPLAIVPVAQWDLPSQEALRFATSLTRDVQVVHIESDEEGDRTCEVWQKQLDVASRSCGVPAPLVVRVPSPYRRITTPILKYILKAEADNPERRIAVIVPELVANAWWQYLLHNHRSTVLKGLLLVQSNRRVVVINVPWYLAETSPIAKDASQG